ncbi:MAG: two-component sensor histidine kinase, partial [Desulfuromonadaceae bacterium]|nr:two-component sensor histidine kinase [Desulfuromonadaceae bacterium]
MKIGVTHKLFLVLLTATGLAVVSSALIMQWSLSRGFLKFVDAMEKTGISRLAVELEQSYRAEKSWEFLQRDPSRWRQLVAASLPEAASTPQEEQTPAGPAQRGKIPAEALPEHGNTDKPGPLPPHLARNFDQRLFLLDADRRVLV